MSLRSPLGVALGHGTAGDGVGHWWSQRLSALALVPLTVWLLVSLVRVPLADYAAVTIWMGSGWNPVWLALTLLTGCWHSRLGVQVVVEDYLHGPGLKLAGLLCNSAVHVLLAASGLYAILRVALRGMP
ncbi:MAG: succinate dehydrogenase, hydrophobic membrane anchor protein [Steroidobacteraceae bacterium]